MAYNGIDFLKKGGAPTLDVFKQRLVTQSCPIFAVHEILQARILEWIAFPFSRGSSQLRD